MAKLGIDFGTTNTTVSYVDNSGTVRTILGGKIRSALYYFKGEDEPMYGKDALEYAKYEQPGCEETGLVKDMKKHMSSDSCEYVYETKMNYPQLIGTFFRKIKEDAEKDVFHGERIEEVCITHPVEDFGPSKVAILKEAATFAGFKKVTTLQEPVAAAMGAMHSMQHKEGYVFHEENVLIFDFGGGTLDLAFVEFSRDRIHIPLPCKGDSHCGGENIDQALYDLFDQQLFSTTGKHITNRSGEIDRKFMTFFCEGNKEMLSKHLRADNLTKKFPVQGVAQGHPIQMSIDYPKWKSIITPTIDRAMELMDEMVAEVKRNNKKIDRVILIGGSSSIPDVRTAIKERFNLDCYWIDEDRDYAVSNGAAIKAHYGDMPRTCFCMNCGKQLLSNMRKCDKPDCLHDNYFYDHAFDGR